MTKIPLRTLLKSLFRSFFLQASWNFERMQSLGAVYVLLPSFRKLLRKEELVQACKRHLEYFNTHPYFAPPVLGMVLALEEKKQRGEEGYFDVGDFKGMVMAPYAAMGDALFWGGVRPLSAVIAVFWAAKGSLWAPVIFLLLFNSPHLWFRVVGFLRGYALGVDAVAVLQRHRLPDIAIRLKEATVVLLGGLCAYLVVDTLGQANMTPAWGVFVIPLIGLLAAVVRKGFSPMVLVFLGTALILAFPK